MKFSIQAVFVLYCTLYIPYIYDHHSRKIHVPNTGGSLYVGVAFLQTAMYMEDIEIYGKRITCLWIF